MAALAPYLKAAAATLTRLELAANGITVTGAETLGGALSGSAVAYLELSGNAIGDPGVYRLGDCLRGPALTLVGLHANWIGDEGAAHLAAALHAPSSALRYVGLNKNRVGDRGAAVLAAALGAKRSAVATLKLDNNDVGDAGASELAAAISKSPALETLRLVGNPRIGAAGAAALAAAQRTKPSVAVDLGNGGFEGGGGGGPPGGGGAGGTGPPGGGPPGGSADGRVVMLNEGTAAELRRSTMSSVFVYYGWAHCGDCGALAEFWSMIAEQLPGKLYGVACETAPKLCASRDVAPAEPAFDVWRPGGDAERYDGEKSTEGVVNFIKANLGLGAAMGAPVPGVPQKEEL